MTRDDLRTFRTLEMNFESIGLLQSGAEDFSCFCTPVYAEYVGRIGCDGVHFVLLPGDERVFCVDPAMGEVGTFVLPVAGDFREFLSFVLFCQDANPLSQIWWMTEERFRELLAEDAAARATGNFVELFIKKDASLAAIEAAFGVVPTDPYEKVKVMQAAFDPDVLRFSDEYFDMLGIERE